MSVVARVLIDSPLPQLDRLLDYAIPEALVAEARPGVRVSVPLRAAGRIVEGWIVELGEATPTPRPLSELAAVVSPLPVLPRRLYDLARAAADRAAGGASDILRLAIPKRMVRAEKAWRATSAPEPAGVPETELAHARSVLDAFVGLADAIAAGERIALDAPPRPSARGAFGAWAELAAAVATTLYAAGRSTVLVVPDYRDQEQLLTALSGLPDGAVVPSDARRPAQERYGSYLRLLAPVPAIVVGNRSTVYAPAHEVGAVLIWDDGDPLLSEPLSPGVHARDAALIRQEQEHSALVFLGHTRTTDVQRLVQIGWVREVAARRRESPRVVLSATTATAERGTRVPSAAFAAAREGAADGPVLVQVARPGYSPVLVCAGCRTVARCPHCAGPLRARHAGEAPECGWCGRRVSSWHCPHCADTRLRMASSGSERTADELGRAFPNTRVILSDGDHPVTEVAARPALVIATRGSEPIAVGGYRAVILLDGERMLMGEQLRIGESCLRWWSNAAALAAPGVPVHLVGVTGGVARALATWTQPAYARTELAARAPLQMPPTVRVASVEGEQAAVEDALAELRREVPTVTEGAVLGPVPVGDGAVRALVRVDYTHGRAVAEKLRAAVIAHALRSRRGPRGRGAPAVGGTARNTLRVRFDLSDLEL